MNKLINFIESEWSRPAIVCFTIFLFFFFTFFLSLAEKREAHRIETQTQSWKDQGYPIGEYRVVKKQIQKIMKLSIDRFTVVALCITAITGIAINKFEIVSTLISWMM